MSTPPPETTPPVARDRLAGLADAALGIAAFVFLALFFATGLIVNRFVRGV